MGSATEEINLTEETTSTCPVHGTCEDISALHRAVIIITIIFIEDINFTDK